MNTSLKNRLIFGGFGLFLLFLALVVIMTQVSNSKIDPDASYQIEYKRRGATYARETRTGAELIRKNTKWAPYQIFAAFVMFGVGAYCIYRASKKPSPEVEV